MLPKPASWPLVLLATGPPDLWGKSGRCAVRGKVRAEHHLDLAYTACTLAHTDPSSKVSTLLPFKQAPVQGRP